MDERDGLGNDTQSTIYKRQFELKRNFLYEAIVGVLDNEEKPHFAPIGVRVIDAPVNGRVVLEARVFLTAKTYSCLSGTRECIVHFPGYSQLDLYFLPFHDDLPGLYERVVRNRHVGRGREVASPLLPGIANYLEAAVSRVDGEAVVDAIAACTGVESRRGVFTLESKVVVVRDARLPPVNRQDGLVLEFLVKASRVRFYPRGAKDREDSILDMGEILAKMEDVAPGDGKNALARALLVSLAR